MNIGDPAEPQRRGNLSGPRRSAFSIIELVAVIVILGVLGGIAAVSLRGWVDRRTVAAGVDRIADADAAARRRSVRDGGGGVVIGPDGIVAAGRTFRWPAGVSLSGVGPLDAASPVTDSVIRGLDERGLDRRELAVRFDGAGRGPSYRVAIAGSFGRRVVDVIGVGGQVVQRRVVAPAR